MSLVIENAYKFNDEINIDINSLKGYTDNICKFLRSRLDKIMNKEICTLISMILDLRSLDKSKEDIRKVISYKYDYEIEDDIHIYKLILNLIKRDCDSNLSLFNTFDLRTNLFIYPVNNKVLFRISSVKNLTIRKEGDEIIDLLQKEFPIISYDYWNSTDKPSDISEEEWDIRRNDWNKIIYNPFTWEINVDKDYNLSHILFNLTKIGESIRDLYDDRIDFLVSYIIDEEIDKKLKNEDVEDDFHLIVKKHREYKKSDYFKDRREILKKDLSDKIPKIYEKEILKKIVL